jgi:hypothetical protein
MQLFLDHVAVLVKDVEEALRQAEGLGLEGEPAQEFPGEGTKESYVGTGNQSARLLLMQPLGEKGPYARALRKRGPGLHHLAIAHPDPRTAAGSLPGWLVHPISLTDSSGTVWLARPGIPTLLEVSAGSVTRAEPVVERIELPMSSTLESLLDPLGDVVRSNDAGMWLTLKGKRVPLEALLGC